MGQAEISCISGCHCSPVTVDFHETTEHDSLLKGSDIVVTESHTCDMSIRVLNVTSSGEYKTKLVQVVVRLPADV